MLESLGTRLDRIGDLKDDEIAERLEDCMLDIIQYANATGISLDMSVCPYTAEQIEGMLEVRKMFDKEGA